MRVYAGGCGFMRFEFQSELVRITPVGAQSLRIGRETAAGNAKAGAKS